MLIKKPIYKRWWAIVIYVIVGFIILGSLVSNSDKSSEKISTSSEPKKAEIQIVSTSFSDYSIYCDWDATSLQKENTFNEKFKDKYIKWSGYVSSVDESWGSYKMIVKHCPMTLVSDIIIKMKDNQKDKLLTLKKGDKITYTARLTDFGEILGLSADNGELVS